MKRRQRNTKSSEWGDQGTVKGTDVTQGEGEGQAVPEQWVPAARWGFD